MIQLNPLIIIAAAFVLTDAIYLSLISARYGQVVRSIQGSALTVRLSGAIMAYIALIAAYYIFIYLPNEPLYKAALLGLFIYAVYDGTNLAIFKNYDYMTALIDTVWGSVLFSLVWFIMYIYEGGNISV
jgi:uncharacterized membrane protein